MTEVIEWPLTVAWSPWYAYGPYVDWERGIHAWVEMGTTLPCGHKIEARTVVSLVQLRRNFRRKKARHIAGHAL